MLIGAMQTQPVKGDIAANISAHLRLAELAIACKADFLIFPELSITGYEPELAKDLAVKLNDHRFQVFQTLCNEHRVSIGIGAPLKQRDGVSISLLIFQPGQERKVYSKKYLHHEDEKPYFNSDDSHPGLLGENKNISLAICYEISVPEHADDAVARGAKMYIASAVKSKSAIEKSHERLASIAKSHKMTVLLSNCIGESGGYDCAGKSSAWNEQGLLIGQLDDKNEGILIVNPDTEEVTIQSLPAEKQSG
jgi:predicted amidohydrolase